MFLWCEAEGEAHAQRSHCETNIQKREFTNNNATAMLVWLMFVSHTCIP